MNTAIITTLLNTALTTLTTILGMVNTVPGVPNLSQQINAIIAAITGSLNIITIPNR